MSAIDFDKMRQQMRAEAAAKRKAAAAPTAAQPEAEKSPMAAAAVAVPRLDPLAVAIAPRPAGEREVHCYPYDGEHFGPPARHPGAAAGVRPAPNSASCGHGISHHSSRHPPRVEIAQCRSSTCCSTSGFVSSIITRLLHSTCCILVRGWRAPNQHGADGLREPWQHRRPSATWPSL